MTKLTLEKYEDNAHSTIANSTSVHLDVAFNTELVGLLKRFVELARSIDTYKKAAFYGRNIETFRAPIKPLDRKGVDEGIIHGVLGIAGESGEVVELLLKAIESGEVPETMEEELGDVLWYVTVAARASGSSLESVGRANNKKLKDRWGDNPEKNDFKS